MVHIHDCASRFPSISYRLTHCRFQSKVNVRVQAIITELVFEHALRVRMKAGTNGGADSSAATTATTTPDSASQVGDEVAASDAGEGDTVADRSTTSSATIIAPSSTSSKGKGKGKAQPEPATAKTDVQADAPKAQEKNIVGRINNLVTSDLSSLDNSSMNLIYSSTCHVLPPPCRLTVPSYTHC